MAYRILFYYPNDIKPTSGGVERITRVLGDWLKTQGHIVTYVSDSFIDGKSILPINKGGLCNERNKNVFSQFLHDEGIDYIINQAGILPQSHPLTQINRGRSKLISVFHNSLDGMYSHPNIGNTNMILLKLADLKISKCFFKRFFYLKYHTFLKDIANKSDAIVLLSDKYKPELYRYAGTEGRNVVSIGNPLTLPIVNEQYEKKREIICLGRLNWQKRPDILLDIWQVVSKNHQNWILRFIGDGEMRNYLEEIIDAKNIKNVFLEGTQNPEPYLKSASILCMTSRYEGFPLVLYEAMNFGVVPIAFDTFAALKDIIHDGFNGVVVKDNDKDKYIDKLETLMTDNTCLKRISINCLNTVKDNTIDIVGAKWLQLFDYLKN